MKELLSTTPLPNLSVINSVNSDYSNWTEYNKNCYLVFAAGLNDNVRFANKSLSNRDSQDILFSGYIELGHELVDCFKCNRLMFSLNCRSCTDSAFLYDCRHYARLKQRNPLRLWRRKCMSPIGCENEFETSYAPERKEIIYCENCYQQAVM